MSSIGVSDPIRIPEGVSGLLRDLIHDRTGIFFEDSRLNVLLEKLEPVAKKNGHQSFLEYYYLLKDDSGAWDDAWEALSVPETYFYREMAQVNYLTRTIVPEWFANSRLPFRIWSAACASGEEPFSIAIALNESGWGAHPIEIVASDAHAGALQRASEGIYREKSFRSFSPSLREKYFSPVEGRWKISEDILRRVTFKRANLLDSGEVSPLARANVIFCRNVFIYFSPHSIRQTVAVMAARMRPRGYLFVGASESLWRMTTDFEMLDIAGATAYRRLG